MFDKVYVVPKLNAPSNPLVKKICERLEKECYMLQIEYVNLRHKIDEKTLVVAVGGDGTMLEAMRIAQKHDGLAVGINLGNVGFLTDFGNNAEDINDLIYLFANQDLFPVENRISIRILNQLPNCIPAPVFNEYVISNVSSDELVRYRLEINDIDAGFHRANAVIVGTPTGSTAYTLSAGGSLMYPSMNVMQIVPVAPLSLSSRPIIVPSDATVRITAETEGSFSIRGDGKRLCQFEGNRNIPIEITQSLKYTRILHSRNYSFFDMLTNKLHWKKE